MALSTNDSGKGDGHRTCDQLDGDFIVHTQVTTFTSNGCGLRIDDSLLAKFILENIGKRATLIRRLDHATLGKSYYRGILAAHDWLIPTFSRRGHMPRALIYAKNFATDKI